MADASRVSAGTTTEARWSSSGMGRLIADYDWSASSLGSRQAWPAALEHAVRLMLPARAQIVLFWGPDYAALYNDAYAPTIGVKHPRALGRPAVENWGELWDDLEPLLRRVRETGETVFATDRPFYIERSGAGENVYFDISYSPVFEDDGGVGGVLCIVSETTHRVRAEQRATAENERLAHMFDQAPGFVALLEGPEHIIRLTNAAHQEIIGGRDVIGKPIRAALPEIEGQGFFELLDNVYRSGKAFTASAMKAMVRRSPGAPLEERYADFVYQPISGPDGATTGIFVQGTDVTEQWRAIEARRDSENRLALAAEAAAIGTWEFNPATGELRWDSRCRQLFGLGADDPVDYDGAFLAGLHPEDRARVDAAVARALAADSPGHFDVEHRTIGLRDGVERWLAATGQRFIGTDGTVRFVGVVIDITGRKRAEAELARSGRALREESHALEILNTTAANIAAELELETLVQAVVDAGVELSGAQFGAFFYNRVDEKGESYTLYSLSGAPLDAFAGFPMPRNTPVFAPTFTGEGVVRSDDITRDQRYGRNPPRAGMPPGHLPVRSYLAVPVASRSGTVIGGLFFGHAAPGMFSERSERLVTGLAAQAAIGIDNATLFETLQRLNQVLESRVAERTRERDRIWHLSRDPFLVADAEGHWLAVSPMWSELLGWSERELLGRTSEWMEHPDDRRRTRAQIGQLAKGDVPARFENRFRSKAGDYRWFSWTAVRDGDQLYCVARDVTREKEAADALQQAEEALRQAQKMETLGQLTGGVAHDFNNLLQVVSGNLELLQRNLPADAARLRRAADNAMNGARRAATLTQRLLAFSRRQPLTPRQIDPSKLVSGMSELLRRSLGETIEIETVHGSGLWRVEVDPNQLENAILNLAVNARDAMATGGKLTIETSNTLIDRDYVTRHAELTAGQYVVISVSDTGTGMDSETLQHAFEPFFTTKEVGKGTGLGLSMVYGFVKQSGGHVKIYSEPREGTSVKIYLPRLLAAADDTEPATDHGVPDGSLSEVVLVCEDDDDVRAYSVEVLRELGYTVIEAADGPAALKLLEGDDRRVDLLFTDVVLPGGMSGAALAVQARAVRPRLKVLFTTGYARNAIVHHGRLDPGVELITKPFSFTELATRVRDILDFQRED
ncbi:PAS domain S-box protein [Chelatococcus reniformis]|uniref:histidine kinase n=1 Tax=Chelatococcus reniformis TaxID=1494448 RepID=A0A916TX62_9HYPH|nr:PAS domain S-box protein [Chelatococcus reniformis]GGC47279.1 hypothetical protein GCM10010994_03060 [Chelatococcus reniformis]